MSTTPKNGRWAITVISSIVGIILVLAGFIVGSQREQIRATEKYVQKDQYNRDIAEVKAKLDVLLQFHLEARAGTP